MKWREAIVIVCGDDMNVACVNNNSVSVALDARAV